MRSNNVYMHLETMVQESKDPSGQTKIYSTENLQIVLLEFLDAAIALMSPTYPLTVSPDFYIVPERIGQAFTRFFGVGISDVYQKGEPDRVNLFWSSPSY